MITILHLSDVHLSNPKLPDFGFVRDALLNDLTDQRQTHQPDLVIFSGDLVHAGGTDDDFYVANEKLIEPVLSASHLSQSSFFIVPGNHDIDREEVRKNAIVEDGQFTSLSSREKVNSFVDHILRGGDVEFNFRRLKNFFSLRDLILATSPIRCTPFFATYSMSIRGTTVGIACLNTAWRATGEEGRDYGRLLLGERAVTETSSDIAHCDVRIGIFHHPLYWLREFDREDCRPLLMRDFDLLLTGHTHRQSPEWQETPMGRAVFSEGGALYVSRRWFNGYCFILFDKQRNHCEFTVRRYEDDRKVFTPASNVADSGRFIVRLRGPEDLKSYLSIESILQQLRPFWEEKAREQMLAAYPTLPATQGVEHLYVPLEFSNKNEASQIGASDDEEEQHIREIDIANAKKPVLIYARREGGKTTLGYYLGHLVASGRAKELKIPVYINLAFLNFGTEYVEKAIRHFLREAGVRLDEVNEYLEGGSFFIVVDNFESSHRDPTVRSRKLAMLESFLKRYSKNQFVLLADRADEVTLAISPRPTYNFEHETYYMQPLTRRNIRAVAHARLLETGRSSKKNVDAILDHLENANLPKTPYVVLMLIAVMEADKTIGRINEATLLERFVEGILNKASAVEFDRASIDFKLKDAFLAHLAYHMSVIRGGSHLDKNDLISYTVEFYKARSWPYDAAAFLSHLIQTGILYQGETDEGTMVPCRYGCFRQFYVARYFQIDRTFLERIVSSDLTIDYIRELDLYTGLTRNESALMKVLTDRARHQADSLNVLDLVENYELGFKYVTFSEISDAIVGEVKGIAVSDEEVDRVMDLAERQPERTKERSELETGKLEHVSDSTMMESRPIGNYYGSIAVLSAVVRNSELIDNPDVKLAAVSEALDGWTFFAGRHAKKFDGLAANIGSADDLAKFARLSQEERKSAEVVAKAVFPVVVGMIMGEQIETDKLRSVFHKCYSETNVTKSLKRVLLFCILIDLAFVHGREPQTEAIKLVEELIRTYRDNFSVLALLLGKLNSLYFRPNLGDENRRAIEKLMTDIYLKCHGVQPKHKGVAGTLRDQFLKTITRVRERKERLEQGAVGDRQTIE